MIEKKLGCKIIRINPDSADFNIYRLINQIHMHIKQSTTNHSIKSKCLKWIVKNVPPAI